MGGEPSHLLLSSGATLPKWETTQHLQCAPLLPVVQQQEGAPPFTCNHHIAIT